MSDIDKITKAVAWQRYGLEPFDPSKHKPVDIGLGGPSTEYLATEYDPAGRAMNYPTIWWDQTGNPQLLDPFTAYDTALAYEATMGAIFPRHANIGAADFAAQNRSANGGATKDRLVRALLGYKP